MATNPYVNKVQAADGSTIMDITDTTAESGDVLTGEVFYARSGQRTTGTLSDFTGATASSDGTHGLVPAPLTGEQGKFLCGDGSWQDGGRPMVILSYGSSTWQDFINAYNNHVIVYCRASSNENPASGSQTRMAFMAYVDDASSPTNVEFQYYRSVSSHSDSQQGDQVYVYKLTSSGTWTVTVHETYSKVVAGTNMSSSYSNGVITLSATVPSVVNNLTSDSTTDALSAAQGKALNTAVANKINTSDIANNLTTTAEGKVLDARQGKALSDTVSGKVSGPSSVTAGRVAVFDGTSGKVIKDSGYTIAKSVPSNADFTNTWRGIQNNLTSTSTTDSLSAAQGKILNESIANKSKIQTVAKTVTVTKGAGSIAKSQIPGTVISAYMTDGWKVAVSQNGNNYSVLVFTASNGAFTVYPNDNWGVSITFVYY